MHSVLDVIPLVVMMLIPLVAIVGGITIGIVKASMRQRLLELAQKERIAAIERGIDPERLPAIELPAALIDRHVLTMEQRALRRSHLLTIWGLLVVSFGIAMGLMGLVVHDDEAAAPGAIFLMMGLGLLAGSRVGRPSADEVRKSVEDAAARKG